MKFTSAELNPGALTSTAEQQFSVKEKQKLLYFLSLLIFTCITVYFFAMMMQQHASIWSAVIFAAIFFCAGVLHIFLFPRWVPPAKAFGLNLYLLYSVLMTVVVIITSLIIFWSNRFHLQSLCFIAGIAFLLPSLATECFQLFAALPKSNYEPWIFPKSTSPEKKMSLLLNSTLFKIHVQLKKSDDKAVLFNITLPRKLTVDTVFRHFFYDHQQTIDLHENGQAYGWHFFANTWYGRKALDPNLSLAENGIREDDIIYAKRADTFINN